MNYNEHLTAGLAAAWDCTADEAVKRLATKRKRVSHENIREDIPWTAARCNRLLRTITSRINILRRQAKLCAAPLNAKNISHSQQANLENLEEQTPPPASRRSGNFSPNDPDWVPGARAKPFARTYTGKQRLPSRPATKKADSGFSTPFVKRLLTTEECLSIERPNSNINWNQQIGRSKGTRQLPVQLGSSNEEAQRNLVTAFSSLLAATSEYTPERTGAPSLLNSCLRRVPDYISLEAEETELNDDESEDVSSSIYAELESLGTNSNAGWIGLREVVRAQCVQHVRAAVKEKLVHDSRVTEMISACSRNGALREADSLLESWIARDSVELPRKLDDTHPAITKLGELRSTHHTLNMYLRGHAGLIKNRCVWISDALRPGSAPLKEMIKALVRGPGQDEALSYLEIAVLEDCKAADSTSLPIFSRLAGLLVSIALTQAHGTTSSSGLDVATIVHMIAIHVLQSQDNRRSTVVHPFVMASTLLHVAGLPATSNTVTAHIPHLITNILQHQSTFVKFTCNVVHHVFRFSSEDELRSLLLTTRGFLSPPVDLAVEQRDCLGRMAFEIAFAYSEQTGVNIDQHFADNLNATGRRPTSATMQTPRRRIQVSGFKWEEGLCEWVAATPLSLKTIEPPSLPEANLNTPKQLLTPKIDRPSRVPGNNTLVIPSSPDIIAGFDFESPKRETTATQPSQSSQNVLKERSTNAHPTKRVSSHSTKRNSTAISIHSPPASKQVHLKAEREKKPAPPLAPVEGKQVHLKDERAKKAALLASQALTNERKRAPSLAGNGREGVVSQLRPALEDTDELGIFTPAKKRCRGSVSFARSKSFSRASMPRQSVHGDGMSDDELGL